MYIIDYPNQKIKKFSNQELESFLNKVIKKMTYDNWDNCEVLSSEIDTEEVQL